MPKLVGLSHDEVCQILIAEGFVVVRQTKHTMLQKTTTTGTVTVPVPNHPTQKIPVGTLRNIIRQSGLSRTLFER
jgi:predicted RNA binding protein YcfA (HicA-like mRNA interferase family)